MWRLTGMDAQDYARKRAVEVAEEDPSQAYDLMLVADELDRTAAKDPDVVTLNRSLRGIKTTAVKYLTSQVPDLIWSAGSNYDYIGLGTTVHYTGSAEANGPSAVRVEVNYTKPNAQYDKPGEYGVHITVHGKGGRQLHGEKVKLVLDDIKRKPADWLKKAVEAVKRQLKGSLDAEKTELLAALDEAETAYKAAGPELKAARKLVTGSKNLLGDASAIRRAITDTQANRIEYPLNRMRRLLDDLMRAGG